MPACSATKSSSETGDPGLPRHGRRVGPQPRDPNPVAALKRQKGNRAGQRDMNLTTADANLRSSDSGNFMGNYDRGIYEPSDDMRVFDSAEEDDDVEGSRLPLLIV